jgi:hypothetical protein
MGRAESQSPQRKPRRDGWTVERQLAFLDALTRTRSISKAARAAGMSRESAYRLRDRAHLFAALWDRALAPSLEPESHSRPWTDGQLMRTLGNDFRRKRGDFAAIGSRRGESVSAPHRTTPL